jgi:hypothetical protein
LMLSQRLARRTFTDHGKFFPSIPGSMDCTVSELHVLK